MAFAILIMLSIMTPGIVQAIEEQQVLTGPINFAIAIMGTGQSKTYTVNSDFFPAMMIIPVYLSGSSTFRVSMSKTDTTGEIIGFLERGYGHPPNSHKIGITPCTIGVESRFWDYGTAVVYSSILFSFEQGPHRYTVTLSY
jgi:hypothetical protein